MVNNKNVFEKLDITQYICVFYKDFQNYCEERLKPYNLTNGLYYYLIFIYKKPGGKLSEISKYLEVDKSHTTRAIQKLINYGYVKKEVNQRDRKSFNLYPTEKCKEVMGKMINLFSEWEQKMIKDFSSEEKEFFYCMLKKAFKNIED